MRCFGRIIGCGVLIVLLAVGAWFFREPLLDAWMRLRGADNSEQTVSLALAESAERKLARLAGDDPPARVALSEAELQSLMSYRMAADLPEYVLEPRITLSDGRVIVQARVPTSAVSGVPGVPASELLDMLPDTTDVEASGHIIPLSPGRVALAVDEVSAATIPLPERMIPRILAEVGRRDEPGVPEDALPVLLPEGASAAFVDGDSLVFVGGASAPPAAREPR